MSTLHTIRLRGPGEYAVELRLAGADDKPSEVIASAAELPPPGRVTMPTTWADSLGPDFRGRVRYGRRFGRPTGVEPGESVWLVFGGAEDCAQVSLNGEPLGVVEGQQPAEFDVTSRLGERNELVAIVECRTHAGGLTGEVSLEIRARPTG